MHNFYPSEPEKYIKYHLIYFLDPDYFFIIPENILIEQNIIKTPNDDINKKYDSYIYIKPSENDKIKYWYRV